MFLGGIDPIYLWCLAIPSLIMSLGVQIYLKSTFRKWGQERNSSGLNGLQVADQLFRRTSLEQLPVENTPGTLTDHFDPRSSVVHLSDAVARQPSVAAMAVAAHELGHVQQFQAGSALIRTREYLLPALRFSPTVAYVGIVLGLMLNMTGLLWIGIATFGLMVLFSILTLPVELDASRRGMNLLREANILQTEQDATGARSVLRAAALTYLAAAIAAVLQLLYYASLARRRR